MCTVFIAVQCFKCSTMQVKQRKKSSNKWNCVVCNEKQSVRKVFSQGFMAKDVRKFVQSFNMSRQYIEQHHEDLQQETLTLGQLQTQNQPRTDWTEYLDPQINDSGINDDDMEPNVVTELPKPLFKKPKLRNEYAAAGLDGEQLLKPVFGKRNMKKKRVEVSGKETGSIVKGNLKHNHDTVDHCSVYERSSSKRDACDDDDVDCGFTDAGTSSVMVKLNRPVSKWNKFIDVDDDDSQLDSRCEEMNHGDGYETKVNDEIVEDDVHPDFI